MQSAKEFGSGFNLGPSLVMLWLFYASRGSDILLGVILCYTLLILIFAIKANEQMSSLSVTLLLMCGLVVVAAQLSMPMSNRYVASNVAITSLAVILSELEGKVLKTRQFWCSKVIWSLGLFYILICSLSFFIESDFLFIYFFGLEGQGVSHYLNGWPRYYNVAALFFLLLPARRYLKIISLILTALPASIPSVIVWLVMHFNVRSLIGFLTIFGLIYSICFGFEWIFTVMQLLIDSKSLSVAARLNKIDSIAIFGNPIGYDDDFSETFWIASSQTVGYLLGTSFFILFIFYIYRYSKNWSFVLVALFLSSVNPFPLSLIVLAAPLWNRSSPTKHHWSLKHKGIKP